MLAHINIYNLLFIDIETVPNFSSHSQLSEPMMELWSAKYLISKNRAENSDVGYLESAGVYSEFAKVICISIGYFNFNRETSKRTFRLASISGDNEAELLQDFATLLQTKFDSDRFHFCGHNIREFDIPFLCRRMLINRIKLPEMLDISGKRPWEMQNVDTLQLWKFGDYKNYTSLKLLANVLGIPSPKDDMEGKDVCQVYWQQNGLKRIVEYCQKDTITVARLLLRFKGDPQPLADTDVIIVDALL